MAGSNEKFRAYVTQTAFSLSLSSSHISAMVVTKLMQELHAKGIVGMEAFLAIEEHRHRMYVPGYWGCVRRGLIEVLIKDENRQGFNDTRLRSKLTPAGEKAFELLIIAELVQPIDIKAMAKSIKSERA